MTAMNLKKEESTLPTVSTISTVTASKTLTDSDLTFDSSSIHDIFPQAHIAVPQKSQYTITTTRRKNAEVTSNWSPNIVAFGSNTDLVLSVIMRWIIPTNYYNHVCQIIFQIIIYFLLLNHGACMIWNIFYPVEEFCVNHSDNKEICIQNTISTNSSELSFVRPILVFLMSTLYIIYQHRRILLSMKQKKVWMNPEITNVSSIFFCVFNVHKLFGELQIHETIFKYYHRSIVFQCTFL